MHICMATHNSVVKAWGQGRGGGGKWGVEGVIGMKKEDVCNTLNSKDNFTKINKMCS